MPHRCACCRVSGIRSVPLSVSLCDDTVTNTHTQAFSLTLSFTPFRSLSVFFFFLCVFLCVFLFGSLRSGALCLRVSVCSVMSTLSLPPPFCLLCTLPRVVLSRCWFGTQNTRHHGFVPRKTGGEKAHRRARKRPSALRRFEHARLAGVHGGALPCGQGNRRLAFGVVSRRVVCLRLRVCRTPTPAC